MTTLHVILDPTGRLIVQGDNLPRDVIRASLSIADDLDGTDIYALARRLAEMLLEQVR